MKSNELDLSVDPFFDNKVCKITNEKIDTLVAYLKAHPHITRLNVSGNDLNDNSAVALASVNSLSTLNLNYNCITEIGLIALLKSPIQILSLHHNKIIIENNEFITLVDNSNLTELSCNEAIISDTIFNAIIASNKRFKSLDIGYITDNALKSIGENITLETLIINRNELTDIGIEYIMQNNTLKTLKIKDSCISNKGANLLSKHPSIQTLFLYNSEITKEGAEVFYNGNIKEVKLGTSGQQYKDFPITDMENFNDHFVIEHKLENLNIESKLLGED